MYHCQKLTDRKSYVQKVVSKYTIDLHWILDHDKEFQDRVEITTIYDNNFNI